MKKLLILPIFLISNIMFSQDTLDDIRINPSWVNPDKKLDMIKKDSLVLDKIKSKAIVTVDDKSLECINKISEAVIQFTCEKRKLWFGKELNLTECKTIFKNNLSGNNLTCFYDENSIFYDAKNTNIPVSELADELRGICLLKCDVVVYTKMYFFIRWEINQFKLKPERSPMLNIYLSEYKIKDLGKGYGAFAKLHGSIIIRDSFLVNIGESYVVSYLISNQDES